MRALALMLATLVLVPAPIAGQAPPTDYATVRLLDDGTADVTITVADQDATAPADRMAALDLKSLDVQEQTESFVFTLAVATLSPDVPPVPGIEQGTYSIFFRHGDRDFRIQLVPRGFSFDGTPDYAARVQASEPGRNQYFGVGAELIVEIDEEAGTFRTTVDRDLLIDSNGAAPQPSSPLVGFRAASTGLLGNVNRGIPLTGGGTLPVPRAFDRMPDSGNGTLDLEVQFGVRQTGHARLHSEIPTRASNGEATTFVYQVEARNLGAGEDRFNLVAVNAPSAWTVKLPASQIPIPGNGSVLFPVLVSTPFTHTHGAFQNFILELRSQSDPNAVGRVELGVRYLDPPQPAGHHNTLWLYSSLGPDDPQSAVFAALVGTGTFNTGYFNAGEDDQLDDGVPVPPDSRNGLNLDGATPTARYCWNLPLSPALELGLDVDLRAQNGTYSIPFESQLPLLGATLTGQVLRIGPADGSFNRFGECGFADSSNVTAILQLSRSTPVDFTGSGHILTGDVAPLPGGDFVPYEKGATLALQLVLEGTRVDPFFGGEMPQLMPGGILEALPLAEYHDPVNDVFASRVELVADSVQDRGVNPGRSALYAARLLNHMDTAHTFRLELAGTNLEWARILGPTTIEVPAGGEVRLGVAIDVPEGTPAGQTADIILTATSEADLSLRSLLRFFAVVETGRDIPDESDAIRELDVGDGSAGTPGPGPLLLLAALVAVALLVRRRRVD